MSSNKASVILFLLALCGCSTGLQTLPDKAIVEVATIARAIETEKALDSKSSTQAPAGTRWFETVEGRTPIIVTAPHATKPFREGTYRSADGGGTGALARALHELTGATVLYTTYASPSDPNYYDDNEFKEALGMLISKKRPILVLDIHGSHPFRPYDVDLGTMGGDSLLGNEQMLARLVMALRSEGLTNISLNYFGASKNRTITKYASSRGVPSIQLEVSSTRLVPSQSDLSAHRFSQLLQALVNYIRLETQQAD